MSLRRMILSQLRKVLDTPSLEGYLARAFEGATWLHAGYEPLAGVTRALVRCGAHP